MDRKNHVEMYWTHNQGKSVVAERFKGTLDKNIYRYMTSISKNVYIVKMSKQKYVFGKGYVPNWSKVDFVIKIVKNTVPWTYFISDFKGKEIVGMF